MVSIYIRDYSDDYVNLVREIRDRSLFISDFDSYELNQIICALVNISLLVLLSCGVYICNSYIPPWGVVVLHIGVGHSWTPMCKTTPQGGI